MKEEKVSTHQGNPLTHRSSGSFKLRGERSEKGAPKAKWRLHHRDYTKQDFSTGRRRLTGSHSPTARGSWGEEA